MIPPRIGFVGLGIMGYAMAKNILKEVIILPFTIETGLKPAILKMPVAMWRLRRRI